jgi:CRP/FNR family transcriptional regulator
MYSELLSHINKFIDLSKEDERIIESSLKSITVKKKQLLLEEGQVCRSNYFIVSGCCRLYFIDIKGVEQTIQFGIENWWITDYTSFQMQNASHFYIQAVENSTVIALDYHQQDELFKKIPKLERYFRLILQKAYSASQLRTKYFYSMTSEEMYWFFSKLFPEFVQRVPQYMLASYLGFTPEFLSKIRAKKP